METPKNKMEGLCELKERIDYLLGHWQCLDGEGLTDEEINRALHYIIEKIEWTYGFDGNEPKLNIIFNK